MAVFFHEHAEELLTNKTVIVMGDSIHRSVYKDIVCLFKDQKKQNSRYLFDFELRAKGEQSFLGDSCLVKSEKATNGTDYREVREFKSGGTLFRFYFITRVFSEYMESVINELKALSPNVIIMNSTFWDIHKYKNGMEEFKGNLAKLLSRVEDDLPKHLVFIWNAAPPLDENCKGGFLNPGTKTLPREEIIEANHFAKRLVAGRGHYFNDLYSALSRHQLFRQAGDGIHWDYRAHRKMTNMILGKICAAWDKPVPEPPQHRQTAVEDNSGELWEGSPYGRNNYYPEAYYPDDEGWEYENENGYFLEPPPPPRPRYPLSRYEEPYPRGQMEDYDELYYPSPSPTPPPRPRSFPEYDPPRFRRGYDGNRSLPDFRNHDYCDDQFVEGYDGNRSLPIQDGIPNWSWNSNTPTPPGSRRASDPSFYNQQFHSPGFNFQLFNQLSPMFALSGQLPWLVAPVPPVFSSPTQGTEDGYKAMFRRFSGGPQSRSRGRQHPYRRSASRGGSGAGRSSNAKQQSSTGRKRLTSKQTSRPSSTEPTTTKSTSVVNSETKDAAVPIMEQSSSNSAEKVQDIVSKGSVADAESKISPDSLSAVATHRACNGVTDVSVFTSSAEKCDANNNTKEITEALGVTEASSDEKRMDNLSIDAAPCRKRKRSSEESEAATDIEQPSKLLRAD